MIKPDTHNYLDIWAIIKAMMYHKWYNFLYAFIGKGSRHKRFHHVFIYILSFLKVKTSYPLNAAAICWNSKLVDELEGGGALWKKKLMNLESKSSHVEEWNLEGSLLAIVLATPSRSILEEKKLMVGC
ncbi:hypothetical protein Tco_1560986 [Tanacetum coccineum]